MHKSKFSFVLLFLFYEFYSIDKHLRQYHTILEGGVSKWIFGIYFYYYTYLPIHIIFCASLSSVHSTA